MSSVDLQKCLAPPQRPPNVEAMTRRLEAWAEGRDIQVIETQRVPDELGAGTLGTVGDAGGRHAVYLTPGQSPEERLLTLEHELTHLVLEFGAKPPPSGGIVVPHEIAEPRAYASEALFAIATGLEPIAPDEEIDVLAAADAVGWAPLLAACEMAEVARGDHG